MRSHLVTAVVAACTFWLGAGVRAGLITFDPDGPAGANGAVAVGGLDLAPGNTLFQFPSDTTFQFNHHAALAGLIDANGTPIATPGLNSTFEITVVSSVLFEQTIDGNQVVSVSPAAVQPADTFIEIWYDTTPDANSLAGTGYNDGTRIYFASPSAALGGFASQAVDQGPLVPYDQFGADDYPGRTTRISTGSYFFGSTTNLQDPGFFASPVTSVELTTGIDTPFDLTNPSQLFTGLPGGVPPSLTSFVDGLPFQADGALRFDVVPEPAGCVLLALCLPLLARRRRAARAA